METTSGSTPGKQKGSRVRVRLPGDNADIREIALEVARALKGRHVFFRRGGAIVFPSPVDPKMLPMTPLVFRAAILEHVCFVKSTYSAAAKAFIDVRRTLNTTDSQTIMEDPVFWSTLPEIKQVHPCPLPVLRDDGSVELLKQGYDALSGIYTF